MACCNDQGIHAGKRRGQLVDGVLGDVEGLQFLSFQAVFTAPRLLGSLETSRFDSILRATECDLVSTPLVSTALTSSIIASALNLPAHKRSKQLI